VAIPEGHLMSSAKQAVSDEFHASYGEKRAMAKDLKAQERADATPDIDTPVLSPGYVRCAAGMHPDHGEAVVFVPGQLLPDWAADALASQRPVPTPDGIYELVSS
jgi:hypothetical protein